MFEHGISKKWLRRAQWAIYVFFGTFAFGGLWYVFYSAFHREVFDALIGAGVVWGSIGLGIGMHCVTQMATLVDANQRALSDLHKRADALEELVVQIGPGANLSALGPGDPSELVAAATGESFPRLVPEADSIPANTVGHLFEHLERPTNRIVDVRRADAHRMEVLRSDFREAVFDGDYRQALAIGREIAEEYSSSPMAGQFEELRPLLELRAAGHAGAVSVGVS